MWSATQSEVPNFVVIVLGMSEDVTDAKKACKLVIEEKTNFFDVKICLVGVFLSETMITLIKQINLGKKKVIRGHSFRSWILKILGFV